MTVQTEITGEPGQLVTIVDFRGRVLKSWKGPRVEADASDAPVLARKWHRTIEAQVRESLAQAAKKQPRQRAAAESQVASHLFIAAMQAYADRDFQTALGVLRACALLLPDDPRIQAALRRLGRATS